MAFSRIINALLDGSTFRIFGDGDQSRGWTYVGDVVEATASAASEGRGVYNVGGAIEASLNEAIELLERVSGRRLEREYEPAVPGDQKRTQADTTRICDELGWAPSVGLEEGLAAQWQWASARVTTR
jgi:UDP-glucose 4-epimerase